MRYIKYNAIFGVFIIIFLFLFSICSTADPVLENVTIDPKEPTVKSDVTVTASFDWSNITDVALYVEECSSELQTCFITHQTNMTQIDTEFSGTVTLTRDKTNYLTYYFDIVADGETYRLINLTTWTVNLKLDTDNDTQNGDGTTDGSDNGAPGFELLILFIAIVGALLIYRKRLR